MTNWRLLRRLGGRLATSFDECKVAAWIDTEGHIGVVGTKQFPRSSAIARVAQKERKPLSEYCRCVSAWFRIRCTVAKVSSCYVAQHVATLEFLDAIEPFIETENKKRQISNARKLYAERGFRLTFLPKEERMRRLGGVRRRPKKESQPLFIFQLS